MDEKKTGSENMNQGTNAAGDKANDMSQSASPQARPKPADRPGPAGGPAGGPARRRRPPGAARPQRPGITVDRSDLARRGGGKKKSSGKMIGFVMFLMGATVIGSVGGLALLVFKSEESLEFAVYNIQKQLDTLKVDISDTGESATERLTRLDRELNEAKDALRASDKRLNDSRALLEKNTQEIDTRFQSIVTSFEKSMQELDMNMVRLSEVISEETVDNIAKQQSQLEKMSAQVRIQANQLNVVVEQQQGLNKSNEGYASKLSELSDAIDNSDLARRPIVQRMVDLQAETTKLRADMDGILAKAANSKQDEIDKLKKQVSEELQRYGAQIDQMNAQINEINSKFTSDYLREVMSSY